MPLVIERRFPITHKFVWDRSDGVIKIDRLREKMWEFRVELG